MPSGGSTSKGNKPFSPYRESEIRGKSGKVSRSPAKIRIAASIRNQPYKNNGSKLGTASQESERSQEKQKEDDPNNMTSMERLEPYLKTSTPLRPMKNFVSTVSYLRPATENKAILPQNAHQHHASSGSKHPQRLQSAGTLQGNYAANRVAKKRAQMGRGHSFQPMVGLNANLQNVKSGHTRATNISSNEMSSPVMNNITEKGLSIFPNDNRADGKQGAE